MFSGLALPFEPMELVTMAWDLVTLFGPYVIIGIGLALTPKFISIIKGIFASRRAA